MVKVVIPIGLVLISIDWSNLRNKLTNASSSFVTDRVVSPQQQKARELAIYVEQQRVLNESLRLEEMTLINRLLRETHQLLSEWFWPVPEPAPLETPQIW